MCYDKPFRLSDEAARRALGYDRSGPKATDPAEAASQRVLLMIDLVLLDAEIDRFHAERVVSLRFAELNARALAQAMPMAIALPLVSRGTDAVQIMQFLAQLGYAGPVHVFAPRLPHRVLVERELKAVSGKLTVHLIEQLSA